MQAQEISQLLGSWGYDQAIIDKFKEEGIETYHLPDMSEYSIEKLFPKIGERTTFIKKIKNMYYQEIPVKKKRMSCESDTISLASTSSATTLSFTGNPAMTLEKLLGSGADGKIILSYYQTEHKLNDLYRQKLADEIIKHELNQDITKSLPNNVIEYWSELIIKFFSGESYVRGKFTILPNFQLGLHAKLLIDVVFISTLVARLANSPKVVAIGKHLPSDGELVETGNVFHIHLQLNEVWAGCTKGKHRDSAAGRGLMLNRYYNFRRKLLKVGALSRTPVNKDKDEKHSNVDTTDEEQEDLLRWLQNTKTVHLVLENWQLTTTKRLSMLKASMEIHKYMDEFPVIKCFDGYRLLEIDFNNLYADAAFNLYNEWPKLCSFILSNLPLKEQANINNCCTSDGKKVKTLRALSLLFPIKNIVMKKKQQWRPSKLESKDGLFQYIKTVADLQPSIERKKEKFLQLGLSVGPQLFAVSPDEDSISGCYITVNQTVYNIDSPLKAFDLFFKIFHALHSCYPKEAEREMFFLQRTIYNIQCDSDKQVKDSKTIGLINEYINFSTQI